jgi:broad specificity phosphatase PhoE
MTKPLHTTPIFYFTILRHGESQGNFEGRHQGQADFPLTDLGRQQARSLVDRWKLEKKNFDLIISSPLIRTRETAEIISTDLKVHLELDPLWMERNNGLMAGLSPEEVRDTLPQPDFIHPYQLSVTGESQWELYLRAGRAVQSLINRSPRNYFIVFSVDC